MHGHTTRRGKRRRRSSRRRRRYLCMGILLDRSGMGGGGECAPVHYVTEEAYEEAASCLPAANLL
jgi:hypothetical protein